MAKHLIRAASSNLSRTLFSARYGACRTLRGGTEQSLSELIIAALSQRRKSAEIEALKTALLRNHLRIVVNDKDREGTRTGSISELIRTRSIPSSSAAFLGAVVRLRRPLTVLELGTGLGISGSYLAEALPRPGGRLVTLEGSRQTARFAEANFRSLRLHEQVEVVTGRFERTLAEVLARYGPIDLAFLDGHHDYAATLRYFTQIKNAASCGALIILDDIRWSAGMRSAWRRISMDASVVEACETSRFGVLSVHRPLVSATGPA